MPDITTDTELTKKMVKLDEERRLVKGQLDRKRLMVVTNDVIETITSDAFVEKMRAARDASDKDGGMDAVSKLLSLEGLRGAGAKIPDDFRLTSRIFEDKVRGERFEIGPITSKIPDMDPLGWGACAGAGGLSFCGCGGFST